MFCCLYVCLCKLFVHWKDNLNLIRMNLGRLLKTGNNLTENPPNNFGKITLNNTTALKNIYNIYIIYMYTYIHIYIYIYYKYIYIIYIYIYIYYKYIYIIYYTLHIYIHIHVFRPSQDSSVWENKNNNPQFSFLSTIRWSLVRTFYT